MMLHHKRLYRSFRWLIAPALLITLGSGCTHSGVQQAAERSQASVDAYLSALDQWPGSSVGVETGMAQFEQVFSDLGDLDIGQAVMQAYAENFYFNDTLHTITDRDRLVHYMEDNASQISDSQITIEQIISQDQDVFVRWIMVFVVGEGDDAIRSTSIGISHLRFNEGGQVVLHQDYWDSATAFYAHLPLVGFMVRAAQDRVAE